ncbi:hypothetical protein EBU02_00740, partial [bacterium]|nr:hypothetical protein [bacterium]
MKKTKTLAVVASALVLLGGVVWNESGNTASPQKLASPALPNASHSAGLTDSIHLPEGGSSGAQSIVPPSSTSVAYSGTQNTTPASPRSEDTSSNSDPASTTTPTTAPSSTAAHAAEEKMRSSKSAFEVLNGISLSDPDVRALAVARLTELEDARMAMVLEQADNMGIPVRIESPHGKISILHSFEGDRPVYRTTNNKNAAISSGANLIQSSPYGLDGTGIKVGVWDAGSIRATHRELTGRIELNNPTAPNDDHSTHVAGTITASGVNADAKGMAPKATIASYDWDNDYAEMTASGAATAGDTTNVPISNHSYGYGATASDMGRYETEASTTDALAAALPYFLPFWAAGNEQDTLTSLGGYQSITYNGLAKNIITVGAVNDAVSGGIRSITAATIASFSSMGPCDDGRIKPDLVANGVNLYSSVSSSDSAYDGTYSGTSMATPSAAGSAALVDQLYQKSFAGMRPRASLLKALLIHTADDLGRPGPDYQFGWGLVNVKVACDVILSHKSTSTAPKIFEASLTNTVKTITQSFVWDGKSPIRATLCWTDPAGKAQTVVHSRTPNLVNNLDLKITGPDGTIYMPFVMPFAGTWTQASMSASATTGKNNVDNVEQVLISTPNRAGTYTASISVDGTISGSQAYSLVITGSTAGASFTSGAGEQYAAGTRKKRMKEDAPRLAGSPAKTTSQGAKNLSAYSSVGFTKAPNAEEAGKKIKGVQVKMLWKEGDGEVEVSWSMIKDTVKMLGKRDLGIEPNSPTGQAFLKDVEEAFN